MPLKKGSSNKEIAAGKKPAQAAAITYDRLEKVRSDGQRLR